MSDLKVVKLPERKPPDASNEHALWLRMVENALLGGQDGTFAVKFADHIVMAYRARKELLR